MASTSPIATGALKFGVPSGIGNGTTYTAVKSGTGFWTITFPGIHLASTPHPLLVTTNTCCSGAGPNVAVENYTSLAPLTWTVRTFNLSGVLEDHDFSFVLVPGGQ